MEIKHHIFKVSEIISLIKQIIETAFPEVLIKGEISNLKNYSGNLFFTLKDELSQIKCILFKGYTRNLKFTPKDGMSVIIRGTPSFYETRGDFQIIANHMEPLGIGALKIAFEELKKKLAEKGYFDEKRKKAIPLFPKTIGVITSPKGAVIRDILNILKRRYLNLHIIIFPVKVQGEGAGKEIADAVKTANKNFYGQIDVLILARGGGSFEDLFAFNEEILADAIYHSKIPIISAVGHETDFTIADFVADLRAPTPSAAAELVIQKKSEIISHIMQLYKRSTILTKKHILLTQKRILAEKRLLKAPVSTMRQYNLYLIDSKKQLLSLTNSCITKYKHKVSSLEQHLRLLSPLKVIDTLKKQITASFSNFLKSTNFAILKKKERFSYTVGKLEMLSPLKILSRGYSITFDKHGQIVKDSEVLSLNDEIKTRLNKGTIWSVVTKKL